MEDEDLNGVPPPPISGASLNNSGMELNLQSGDLEVMTMNSGGGFVDLDPDAEVSAYNAVQDILGNNFVLKLSNNTCEIRGWGGGQVLTHLRKPGT